MICLSIVNDIRDRVNPNPTERKSIQQMSPSVCLPVPGYSTPSEYKYLGIRDEKPIVEIVNRLKDKFPNVNEVILSKNKLDIVNLIYNRNPNRFKIENGITFEKKLLERNVMLDSKSEVIHAYFILNKYKILKYQFIIDVDPHSGVISNLSSKPDIYNINPYDYLIEQSIDLSFDVYQRTERYFNQEEQEENQYEDDVTDED